jgi:hypothetical protein
MPQFSSLPGEHHLKDAEADRCFPYLHKLPMRRSDKVTTLLTEQIDNTIRIEEAQSRGRRVRERRRSVTCASIWSSVSSFNVRDGKARKSAVAVLRWPQCSLMTVENDCPGRFCRAKISEASRSIVMVFIAMHLPYT